jgi:general secretion pathway protein J
MERVSDFLVECYDGSKWVKSWDTALNGALPKMLRATVHVIEDGRSVEFYILANSRMGAI